MFIATKEDDCDVYKTEDACMNSGKNCLFMGNE